MSRKIFLAAFIFVVLCFVPEALAESSGDLAPEATALHKTEAEREEDFNKALSNFKEPVSDLERVNFKDGIRKSRDNFRRIYRARWKALGMSQKLEGVISESINEHTGDLFFGTAGIQLGTNYGGIVDTIQESIAFKFAEPYDDFLRDVEEKWGESLQKDLEDFYKRGSVTLLAGDKNPMSRAYIRQNTTAQDSGAKVTHEVLKSLQKKNPDISTLGLTAAGGALVLIFRKRVMSYITKKFGGAVLGKLTASSAGKLAAGAVPVVGWLMMAWSIYDVASIAWNAESDVKKILAERNQSMYVNEMPEVYWDVMEPYVMDMLMSSYEVLLNVRKQAENFANDPRIIALGENLNDSEASQLAERTALAVETLGGDKFDYLLENFGEAIKNSSPQNFKTLLRILQTQNPAQVREWLNVAGTKYYDFYSLFPNDTWENFPPNENSLEILEWLSRKLTPGARLTASKLSVMDLNWIINELPERFVPQLFGSRNNDADTIHYEIARLAEIPDRDSRRPYQSKFEYIWSRYSLYIFAGLGIFLGVLILRIFLAFSKARSKKERASEKKSEQVIIYNTMPPAPQPVYQEPVKKFDVRLKISPELVDEARNILWDITQTLTPDPSDSGARILSVKLDSLEDIKRWIKSHSHDVEILQSEELKQELKQLPQGEIKKI